MANVCMCVSHYMCLCVCVCQSFGVLMNFSALVRFLFVSFECRFVSSFYRYQRARNDAMPWLDGKAAESRRGKMCGMRGAPSIGSKT